MSKRHKYRRTKPNQEIERSIYNWQRICSYSSKDNDDHIVEHICHIENNDVLDQVWYIDIENNNEYFHRNVEWESEDLVDE